MSGSGEQELPSEVLGVLRGVGEEAWPTYTKLGDWTRRRYVRPNGGGKGVRRTWPPDELLILRKMVQCVDAGFTADRAAVIARQAVEDGAVEVVVQLSSDEQVVMWWESTLTQSSNPG